MTILEPRKATKEELLAFHSHDYLKFCEQVAESGDREKFVSNQNELLQENYSSSVESEFGVEYDCPLVANMSDMIAWLAGGSLGKCAQLLDWILRPVPPFQNITKDCPIL